MLPAGRARCRRGGRRSSPSRSPPLRRPSSPVAADRQRRGPSRGARRSVAGRASRIRRVMSSTLTIPRTAPVRSTTSPAWTSASSSIDSASLRVVRRSRRGEVDSTWSAEIRPGRQPVAVDPADRPLLRVHDQDVLEGLLGGDPPAIAPSSPTAAVTTGDSGSSPTRNRLSRLRPRSVPTNRATKSEAGLARISAGGPYCATIPPASEHRHDVAHLDGLVDVVGHEQDRLGEPLLEAQELVLEALADDGVDGAERLVHEHDRRVGGQRPGHARRAAARRRRAGPGSVRRTSRAPGPRRASSSSARAAMPRLRPAQEPRHGDDVVLDRLVREQARLLDDVADAAAELRHVPRRRVDAVEEDAAGGRLDQAVDHLEGRRLAAAGRPDEHADLPRRDREREVVDGARGARPGRPARRTTW